MTFREESGGTAQVSSCLREGRIASAAHAEPDKEGETHPAFTTALPLRARNRTSSSESDSSISWNWTCSTLPLPSFCSRRRWAAEDEGPGPA